MDCTEEGHAPDCSTDTKTSQCMMDLVVQQSGVMGMGGYVKSPMQNTHHKTTAYLTQSRSATLPGLALSKCSQDNYHVFSRPDFSSF